MTASLYQREGSTKWWVRYHDNSGALCRKSTGTSHEAAAQRIAERIEEELAMEATGQADQADDDRIARAEGATATNLVRAPLGEQIDDVEALMLAIVQHQAKGQEIAAKRIASLFRQLASRTRRLETLIGRGTSEDPSPE